MEARQKNMKGAKKMKRLVVDIDAELSKKFKVKCVKIDKTQAAVVRDLLKKWTEGDKK